jgi:integrase
MYRLLKPRPGHPYYVARITLPGAGGKAVTVDKSTKCERRSDARLVADRLHAEAAASVTREPLVGAIEALIGLRVRQKRAQATIEILELKGAQLIAFFGAQRDVGALRLEHTSAYVAKRRADGVSDSTIAKEMGTLRAALRYLRRLERYDRDPDALWPPELAHGSGVRERWLPWPEYLRVLAALRPEFRDHFALYCATGIRFSELYTLRAADLTETPEGHALRVRGTKTAGAARTVPVNPDALEVLQRRAAASPAGPLFPIARANLKSQKAAWSKALRKACRASRLAHTSTNDLRRTFVSWAFQADVSEALTIKWMGHTSSTMVRRVYAQASSEQHAREGAKLPSRRATPGATRSPASTGVE